MKKKLFWIIYYSVVFSAIIAISIGFYKHIKFNWHSLFPLGYIILMLFLMWFYPHRYAEVLNNYRKQMVWTPYENQYEDKYIKESDLFISHLLGLFLPLELIFFLFGGAIIKAISGIIILGLIHLLGAMYILIIVRRKIDCDEEKTKKEQEEKELRGK